MEQQQKVPLPRPGSAAPGPWAVLRDETTGHLNVVRYEDENATIAVLPVDGSLADARLIAAAPTFARSHELLVRMDAILAAPGKMRTAADGVEWDRLREETRKHLAHVAARVGALSVPHPEAAPEEASL